MNDPLVFDIGYNMGNFTKQILGLYPQAKIIGVEGHPIYHTIFNEKPIPNVTLIHALISNEIKDEIPFYICDSNPGINSISSKWIANIRHHHFFEKTTREIKLRSITLDSLISFFGIPDIIKLDIEGAEPLALQGLTKKCGLITFEWAEEVFDDTLICIDLLKSLDYTLFSYTEENDSFNPSLVFKSWEDINLTNNIIPERKQRWGMIYAK